MTFCPRSIRSDLLTAIAVAGLLVGCHDQGPTAPAGVPTSTPLPATPTPTAGSLAGRWTGTVKERGLTDDYFCPGRSNSVTVYVTQENNTVNFDLLSGASCSGPGTTSFQGALTGIQLSGQLRKEVSGTSCVLTGGAGGSGEPSHIHLEASMSGACNSVGLHIDLTR
jgi:hypothetical protein